MPGVVTAHESVQRMQRRYGERDRQCREIDRPRRWILPHVRKTVEGIGN